MSSDDSPDSAPRMFDNNAMIEITRDNLDSPIKTQRSESCRGIKSNEMSLNKLDEPFFIDNIVPTSTDGPINVFNQY